MTSEDADLTFITTERLVDELCRRHDNMVVWGTQRLRTDNPRPMRQEGRVYGDYLKCIGLCDLAQWYIRSLINTAGTEESNTEIPE